MDERHKVEPTVDEASVQSQSESESEPSDDEVTYYEDWTQLVTAIGKTTQDCFDESPALDSSTPEEQLAYWRRAFEQLRESVAVDAAIPQFVTEPPVKRFSVTLFDFAHGLCCPCGHVFDEPNIQVKNPSGVTKLDLLDAFTNHLYGGEEPVDVFVEEGPRCEEADKGEGAFLDGDVFLVYSSGWMSGLREVLDGKRKEVYGRVPNVFLYCCVPEKYRRLKKREDDLVAEAEKKAAQRSAKEAAAKQPRASL